MIYINGRFLTQKITGVQRYATEVVKQIDKISKNSQIVILCPNNIINNTKFENISIKKIGHLKGQLWEQISLPLYLLLHKKGSLLSLCNLAPILCPGNVVLHDIGFKTHGEHLSKKFSMWYRFVTRLNIKRYKHIFTVSQFSKDEIMKNYHIKSEKIDVTYNSAEHLKDIKPNNDIIKRLNLKNKEFNFSLGSKSPHKNHQFIEQLAIKNPDEIFVITGNSNKIFKDNSNENIKNLIYTGYLNDDEIVALYKNCKAFIFPSLYEGFGIPPLEAMQCGCKNVFVSDIPVLKEIYADSVNYINLGTNEQYLLKYQEHDIDEILKKYSWKKIANTILEKIK